MQEQKDRRICRLLVFWAGLLAAFLQGCAGLERRTVMPGDKVDLHFTCRFPGGQVVASSYQDVGRDPALRKADFFLPREKNTPLLLTAGDPEEEWSALKGGGFEGEILSRLAHAVVGLEIGRTHPVEIQADTLPEKTRGEHLGKVARVRERVKELRLTPEEYRSKANRDPQVGQEFFMDPAIPGKVETVSDREVYIRFDAEPGKEVITPFGPEEWIAGREAKFSGAEKMVLGMAVGEKVRMPLPPGAAFGAVDAGKVKSFPLVKKMEKNVRLGARDFVNRFGRFPARGDEVPLTPYFRGRIVEISENDVRLVTEPEDGAEFQEEFGTARIRVQAEYIALTLNPRIGAIFKTPEGDGRIVSATASEFTVDFNHPLAGKAIELEIEAVSLTPQSALESFKIPWREDHDEALASMVTCKKPAVLVLYADWCSWSKKLFKDSLEDPRLRRLHDRLIWIRVNSDQKAEYAKKYQQNGFPLILFFQTDGTLAARIDGFSNPVRLLEAVIPLLEPSAPKES